MEMQTFLEKSLLPAVTSLLSVTQTMAAYQSKEHAKILQAVEHSENEVTDMAKTIETLGRGMEALNKPITQLVAAMNESNRLQAEQTKKLSEVMESLAENTARLNALNVSLYEKTEDPGIKALYDALKKEGGA